MQISAKLMDRLTQIIGLAVLLGIAAALISVVRSGNLPYITDKESFGVVYAYTEEEAE